MVQPLPHDQRKIIRGAIKTLADQKDHLEDCLYKKLKPDAYLTEKLTTLLGTSSVTGQLKALEQMHATTEKGYMDHLKLLAPNDLTAYAEYMVPDEPPADHHVWLCEQLMKMERREEGFMRMSISMAPGHAKSEYGSRRFPSWYIGRNPRHKYLQGGHTQAFCESEFGKPTRAMVDSQRYRDVFPDVELTKDTKAAGTWAVTTGAKYYTKGVGVGIAGFRASCAGIDDPFALRKDAESPTTRQEVWDWFSADFTTRLLPHAPLFLIMTRWNNDDLAARIEDMNKEGRGLPWNIINVPAICIDEENDPMGRKLNEPLWPDFYTYEILMNLKATLESRDWNSLYMGNPVDEEGNVINLSWFGRYERLPDRREWKKILLSVDTANKKNERADFTSIGVWIETKDGQHYLAYIKREKLEFNELVKTINTVGTAWNVDAVLVEDKGSGTQYIQTQGKGQGPHPVIAISTNNNSKEFRMDGATPMIEGGLVNLPVRAEWLPDYELELVSFPFGKNDDSVDMTSQYLNHVKVKISGTTKKMKRGGADTSGVKKDIIKRIGEDILAKREGKELHPVAQAILDASK